MTRERGARGCHRLRWLTCVPSRVHFKQSEIRSTPIVQPAGGKGAAASNLILVVPLNETACVVGPTFFRSAAACLHVRAALTPEPTRHEPRKRRASARHAVGC